jgi:ceramide kinase
MHIALGDACPLDVLRVDEADGRHAFATCMLSYGFMGDVMVESENYRWLGPLRYDVIGAKMLAANRSYHVRVSYLPAQSEQLEAAGKVCTAGCDLCRLGQEHVRLQRTFREVSSRSLAHRRSEWVHVEGDFAGIMLVIMPCRSEKSQQGVARYGHRSDGLIHLVMVKKCSRLQYLRFLLTLSHSGLAAGEHGFFTVVPAVAVHVEPVGAKQSRWNADGELLASNHITGGCCAVVLLGGLGLLGRAGWRTTTHLLQWLLAPLLPLPLLCINAGNSSCIVTSSPCIPCPAAEVHRGVIEVFARGVEV